MSVISKIQAGLKAPKGQENKFGKYKYRSCEDIVEAVKPLLAEHDCYLNISDTIELIGDRYYVKATAKIMQDEKCLSEATAYAREAFERKGMDDSQLTGATSSYARKYALNGLLAIDDTKDADATNDHKPRQQVSPAPINQKHVDACYEMLKEEVDSDRDTNYERMQAGMARLTNDERIATLDKFGNDKPSFGNRKYTTIINDCLNWKPVDDLPIEE